MAPSLQPRQFVTVSTMNRAREGTAGYRLAQFASLGRRILRPDCPDRVPTARQIYEIVYLRARGGLSPLSYYRLGLFRPSLPWNEKKNFVSEGWYRRRMERLNLSVHRFAAWNKLTSHILLQRHRVPTAPFLGVAGSGGWSYDGCPLRSAGDLAGLIARGRLDGACFKLIAGCSGYGFLKVSFEGRAREEVCIQPDGPRMSVDAFWRDYIDHSALLESGDRRTAFGYLCEGVVAQHPDIAVLHPASVNTARVWMYQDRPGHWAMYGALLRMGVGGSSVDNSDQGGIGAPIDTATGRLGRAMRHGIDYREGYNFEMFDTHPTTGIPIAGRKLPMWDRVPPLCGLTGSAFPFFQFMGLDIAFTPDGPVIIEVEADPHSSHQTYMERGLRPLLNELVRQSACRSSASRHRRPTRLPLSPERSRGA